MTREQIIRDMYLDKDIAQAIGKMQPAELQEDLRQEIFLVVSEMKEERLLDMFEKGYLKYFIVRTMLNMAKSDRSTFYRTFRRNFSEYMEHHDQPEQIQEDRSDQISSNMEKLHWYEREIFHLYAENGKNIVRLSKETNIPYRSLFKTVNKVKKQMRSALRKEQPSQAKLLGSYVYCQLDLLIDINKNTDTDALLDILEEINHFIRERIEGRTKNETSIKEVNALKIKKVL